MKYKKIISCILAFSIIFNITPVSAVDGNTDGTETVTETPAEGTTAPAASETDVTVDEGTIPETTVTDVTISDENIITTGTETDVTDISGETTPVESETEIITEMTVSEITEALETTETIDDTLEATENDTAFLSVESTSIQLSKASETDTSITISWSAVYGERFSHYDVYSNGVVVQSGITDNTYTITGLTGGSEYGIAVYAYDIDGNVIGMSNTEYFYTNWNVSGDTVLTSDRIVSNLYINGGTLNLNGYSLTVKGDVYLSAGGNYAYINVNKGKLYVDGSFNMRRTDGGLGEGYLLMTNAEDYICVNGDFYVYSYRNYNKLTDGTIEVKGNFTQRYHSNYHTDNFAPSGNHKVILSGEGLQTIDFQRTESRFNILEIQNYSEEGVVCATSVTINELIDNGCNISFANGERSGWTLEEDEVIEGDLNISRGTLDLNGHKLTVTGSLIHSGGTVLVNGGELEVQGDYRVQALNGTSYSNSTGILNMTNEADTVRVMGDFVMQSTVSHSGKLTAGTLEIGGNLTQIGGVNGYNFCTSGSHTVILNGTEKQSVSIWDNGKAYSRITDLKITNTSAEGVDIATTVYVIGNLYNTESNMTNSSRIVLSGTFADNAWPHDIWLNEDRVLSEDTEIGGNLYLNGGTLNLNGHTLTVKGDVYLSASGNYTYMNINKGKLYVDGSFNMRRTDGGPGEGYLLMTNAEDYICVNGDFYVYTYHNYNQMTNGTIEVKGNFTQRRYGNYHTDNFAPSGDHKVILSGDKIQKVSFGTTQSYLNILEVTKDIEAGYVFSRTPLWNELIERKVDTELPSAPKNLSFVRSNSSSMVISWGASTDNAEVYCYYIYRDGEYIGSTKKLEYLDNGLSSHTTYEYYVVACDTSGNISEWSNILEAQTDVDAFAPTQPANLSAKALSEGTVRLSWTASSDNEAVVKYNIYRDGVLIGSSSGTAFTDSTASGGYYEYYVEAVDNEGNSSRASESVYIDNLAPGTPVISLNSVNDSYVSVSWECSDNVGVVKYDLYKNDVKIKSFNANSYIDTAINTDTNYTYYVKAYDAAGNVSEKSNEVTVYTGEDDEAPVISSIEYIKKPTFKNAVVTVSARDNCGVSKIHLKYSVDKVNWTDCGSQDVLGKAVVSAQFAVDTASMPDGTVYLCAYAEDNNGNASRIEDSPIYSFTVDNTAPDTPDGVVCSCENDTIELRWNAGSDDVSYFRIYRKTDDEAEYSLIKDNYKYLNYFDTKIELGIMYTYYVTAVDENGNESAASETVTGGVSEDKVKPEILSVYPGNSAVLDTNQLVGISAKDNFRLESIVVECRPENGEWTAVFEENDINNYAKAVQFELDTSEFSTGVYELRVYAKDTAGNISDYTENRYTFKECAMSAPVLTAVGEGWRNELSWTMENTEDLIGYHIYRKTSKIGDYSCIASITNSEYVDSDLTPGKTYYYMVEAVDSRNNAVKSNEVSSVPTDNDDIKPLADAGADTMGIAGEKISFNGSNSWDNHYVASYEWDFGDGTTAEGARVSHAYEKDGTYDVTLTVKDSAGNSDSHTIKALVYSNDYGTVQIKTQMEDSGPAIGNVKIYCEIPGVDSTEFMSDMNGNFKFIAPKGTYDVYFYKNGYLPQHAQITVTGENSSVKVELEQKELVEGKIEVRTLDVNEMIALGIDVNAPENQFVYEYTIDYGKDGKLSLTLNATGDIIGEVTGTIKTERDGVFTTVCTIKGEKDSPVRAEHGGYEVGDGSGIPVSVAVFRVSTQLSWLKQFYDVELMVTNNAAANFSIQNAKAVLNLPDGLSLADTARNENLTYIMGKDGVIGGKATEYASWIVRGDKPGSYDLSAEFTGVLMPLNEDVKVVFKTDEPIIVNDGTGLKLDIEVIEGLDYWTHRFTFTNNRELDDIADNDEEEIKAKSIYNFAASFSGSAQLAEFSAMYIEYPDGTVEIAKINAGVPDIEDLEILIPVLSGKSIYDHRTVKPGESVTGYLSVYRMDGFTNDD